jgi:hypothetical protein
MEMGALVWFERETQTIIMYDALLVSTFYFLTDKIENLSQDYA